MWVLKPVLLLSIALFCLSQILPNGSSPAAAQTADANIDRVRQEMGDLLATTADEVIAMHIESIGGKEAMESIKTFMFKGKNLNLSGEQRHIERYLKQPNRFRQQMVGDEDGYMMTKDGKLYGVRGSGRAVLDFPWAKDLVHTRIDGNFIDYAEREITYEFVGLHGFDTEPTVAYHLRRTFPDGHVEELYFDVKTALLRATYVPETSAYRVFYDFRDVGGILFPHMWVRTFGEQTPPHVFIVYETRVNEDYGDGFFD